MFKLRDFYGGKWSWLKKYLYSYLKKSLKPHANRILIYGKSVHSGLLINIMLFIFKKKNQRIGVFF